MAYHWFPIETNFFLGHDTDVMETLWALTENTIKQRIGLALLVDFLFKAITAVCELYPSFVTFRKGDH